MPVNVVRNKFCALLDDECASSDESQCCSEKPSLVERRVQNCPFNASEGIEPNHKCLQASECRESLVGDDSLQRREQICPNISEIIDHEKRYSVQIYYKIVTW